MIWEIVIGKRAEKALGTLPKPVRERVIQGINRLKGGPYQSGLDVKPLSGRPEWRLSIGDWRVLFRGYEAEIRIIVISVSPRGDASK